MSLEEQLELMKGSVEVAQSLAADREKAWAKAEKKHGELQEELKHLEGLHTQLIETNQNNEGVIRRLGG